MLIAFVLQPPNEERSVVVLCDLQLLDGQGSVFYSSRLVVEPTGEMQALVGMPESGRMPHSGESLAVRKAGSNQTLFDFHFTRWSFNTINPAAVVFYGTNQRAAAAG